VRWGGIFIKKIFNVLKKIGIFIMINIFVGCVFSIPMIYYGPLSNIRDMLVTTAMTTFSHQYLATAFLSDNTINEIMQKNKVNDENKFTDESKITVFGETFNKEGNADNIEQEEIVEDKIELKNISTSKYKAYMLIISNPKRVVAASSERIGKAGMKLSDIVKDYNAVGGINAGGFSDEGGHGNGGVPTGFLIEGGKVLFGNEGQRSSLIGFNEDSVLVLGNYTLKEAREKKIRDAVNFGPFLIVNGEPTIKGGNGGGGVQPRTAIGQREDGAVLMLVIDGRRIDSVGATLKEVQDIMLEYGAYNAANLDGGSSTTMFYGGQLVNKPSTPAGERALPSAFIVK
jgi:exopolysaccharide biosynthesis protein